MVKAVEPTQLTYQPQEELINNHGLKPQAYLNQCFKAKKVSLVFMTVTVDLKEHQRHIGNEPKTSQKQSF